MVPYEPYHSFVVFCLLLLQHNIMKDDKKTVYLIRHAESEENRRLASLGTVLSNVSRFQVPRSTDVWASLHLLNVSAQVDSSVSVVGKAQIDNVAQKLQAADFLKTHKVTTVLHSPLQRAQETCQGLLQCLADADAATDDDDVTKPSTSLQNDNGIVRIKSLDILKEKTPAEWLPGNAKSLRRRLNAFEDDLAALPEVESVICVVGHSQYFKNLLNLSYKFRNCDVYKVEFDATKRQQASTTATAENDVLPPQWSGLERLFECSIDGEIEDGGK